MYGALWCGDCRRAKKFFDEREIAYDWYDIDQDPVAREYVVKVNNGRRTIPTILFSDGSILVEPSDAELADKLQIADR